ncbi:hypothetical protein [Prosthecobacter sp.]|uniref:hypothetical protein n=1 Tax=Prosthecobacter sp. TaxID=1965333 RepID=UPI0037850C6A
MSSNADFPALSFNCPKLWAQMQGDEKTRFCDVCQKNVHNLSMMNTEERRKLLASTEESPCVTYFQYLNGEPIDVTVLPEGHPLKRKLLKAALISMNAVAAGSIAFDAGTLVGMALQDQEASTLGKGGCYNMLTGVPLRPPGYVSPSGSVPPPLPPGSPGPMPVGPLPSGGLPPSTL